MGQFGWRAAFCDAALQLLVNSLAMLTRKEGETLGSQPMGLRRARRPADSTGGPIRLGPPVLSSFTVPPTFVTFLRDFWRGCMRCRRKPAPRNIGRTAGADIGQILEAWRLPPSSSEDGRSSVRGGCHAIGYPAASIIACANSAEAVVGPALAERSLLVHEPIPLMTCGMEAVAEQQTASMTGLHQCFVGLSNLIISRSLALADHYNGYDGVIGWLRCSPLVGLSVWLVLS